MAALASDWLRHFRLLLWNRWTEFNETWQEARSQRPLPSLCFSGRSEKQDGRPGLWLAETFSTSPLKPLNGIQRNLTGSKISTSSTKFVFFGPIGKTRWPPWPLIGWDIFDFSSETAQRNSTKRDRKQDFNVFYQVCDFWADRKKDGRPGLWSAETFSTSPGPLKPLNGIQRNLTGSKFSTSSTKFVFFRPISKQKCPHWPISQRGGTLYSGARYVALWASCLLLLWNCWTEFNETDWKQDLNVLYQACVFRADRKNKMAAWPLIGWDILDFSSETAERNSTKLNRKLDLNVLYQVCVFQADQKNKMATLASDWLRLWLLLLNRWTEFNETWQEARSQRPLPSLCFSGRSEKQDGLPGLWLAETFSFSPLKLLNKIQWNLTGS